MSHSMSCYALAPSFMLSSRQGSLYVPVGGCSTSHEQAEAVNCVLRLRKCRGVSVQSAGGCKQVFSSERRAFSGAYTSASAIKSPDRWLNPTRPFAEPGRGPNARRCERHSDSEANPDADLDVPYSLLSDDEEDGSRATGVPLPASLTPAPSHAEQKPQPERPGPTPSQQRPRSHFRRKPKTRYAMQVHDATAQLEGGRQTPDSTGAAASPPLRHPAVAEEPAVGEPKSRGVGSQQHRARAAELLPSGHCLPTTLGTTADQEQSPSGPVMSLEAPPRGRSEDLDAGRPRELSYSPDTARRETDPSGSSGVGVGGGGVGGGPVEGGSLTQPPQPWCQQQRQRQQHHQRHQHQHHHQHPPAYLGAGSPGQQGDGSLWYGEGDRKDRRRPPAGVTLRPEQLMGILRRAGTVQQLQRLVRQYGRKFNSLHVACCMNRLAKASDASGSDRQHDVQTLLVQLERMLVKQIGDCTARELCNALWAWAKLGRTPGERAWQAVRLALFGSEDDGDDIGTAKGESSSRIGGTSAADAPAAKSLGAGGGPAAVAVSVEAVGGGGAGAPAWAGVGAGPGAGDSDLAEAPGASPTPEGEASGAVAHPATATPAAAMLHNAGAGARASNSSDSSNSGRSSRSSSANDSSSDSSMAEAPAAAAPAADGQPEAKARAGPVRPLGAGIGHLMNASPQSLVNAAWALARLGCTDPLAWRRLAEASLLSLPAFTPYDISNLSYAYVAARQHRTHPSHEALLERLAAVGVQKIADFSPQDLSNMLWAYARAGMPQPELYRAASLAVQRTAAGLTVAGITQVLWAYATLRVRDGALMAAMARQMLPRLHEMDVLNLSLLAWALARLVNYGTAAGFDASGDGSGSESGVAAPAISYRLAARVRAGYVDPLTTMYAAGGGDSGSGDGGSGGGGGGDPAAVTGGRGAAAAELRPFDRASTLSSTVLDFELPSDFAGDLEGASACLQPDGALGGGVLRAAPEAKEAEAEADEVTGMARSDAEAGGCLESGGHPGSRRSQSAALTVAMPQLRAFAAASAAGEAVLSQLPPTLLPSLASAILARLEAMDTRYLTVLLWAMATLGNPDEQLFGAAAAVLTRRLRAAVISTHCISHIAWSYTCVQYYDKEMYDAMAAAASDIVAASADRPEEVSLALSNVLWALGSAGHYDAALFASAARLVVRSVRRNPAAVNHLAMVMLACAYTVHEDMELYAEVTAALQAVGPRHLRNTSLPNICWALAVVDYRGDLALFAELFRDVAKHRADSLGARGCTQLFQCCLWLQDVVPGGRELVGLLPQRLLDVGRSYFSHLAKDWSISDFQAGVFNALETSGLRPTMESKTADQLFSLDCVVTFRGVRVVVEANGPQHYLRTHPLAFGGSTRLRSRLLHARGYRLLHVHWSDWQELNNDRVRQRRFLLEALRRLVEAYPGAEGGQMGSDVAGLGGLKEEALEMEGAGMLWRGSHDDGVW